MSQPFLNANPTPDQMRALVKYLSTYRDGSGNIRESDPEMSSRADSRQIERCFAELFGVKPPESKSYYDFAIEINLKFLARVVTMARPKLLSLLRNWLL